MKNMIIIDAICGAGKTSWAIQYMTDKSTMEYERFIYVTPFLSEIERIIKETDNDFKQPTTKNCKGKKTEGLRQLVARGENIVCSHELFKKCNQELLDLIECSGYTLILDEVLNVINEISISKNDLDMLIECDIIECRDDGSIKWKDYLYTGKFEDIKYLAKSDNLFLYNGRFMFWTLNHKSFTAFKEVYVLTYLFDGQIQKYYYDLHNLTYEKKSVIFEDGNYKLIDYNPKLDHREDIARRLKIYEDSGKSKFNTNFCKRPTNNMFSSTWLKNCDKDTLARIAKNTNSFLVSNKATTKNTFWTTLTAVAPKLKGPKATYYKTDVGTNGKRKGNFLSVNIRATNTYKDCTNCVYLYNRFMNPIEKAFFNHHGVKVDEDTLAVSDLIQFIFRGVIRNLNSNEHMNLYLPSIRMRRLLYRYLNYEL